MIFRKEHPIVRDIKETLLATGFQHTYILDVSMNNEVIKVVLMLPYHMESSDLEDLLSNLKEELQANDAKFISQIGKKITILFGKMDLSSIKFRKEYINEGSLKITLPSSFGLKHLDFNDDSSCHLLTGGTTRTGKSTFLLYLSTMLYIQTHGNIELYITSTKAKDYYIMNDLENVNISRSEDELNLVLDELILKYQFRDSLLYSKDLEKATNAKDVFQLYPKYQKLFQPTFLIIDEYARFSENREIQKKIMELVETAGYVNVHVIISTQRPDARTVISPRIKSNLLARVCFTTTDKNNSIVILDQEGAEKLGHIQGRAIFQDGETNIIQVPHIEKSTCEELLKPYRKENTKNETKPIHQETTGSTDPKLSEKVHNLFKESSDAISVPAEHKPSERNKPSDETLINGWFLLASKEGKR